jgi:hypothetical protein
VHAGLDVHLLSCLDGGLFLEAELVKVPRVLCDVVFRLLAARVIQAEEPDNAVVNPQSTQWR